MPLILRRHKHESWYGALMRYAEPFGLGEEARRTYEEHRAEGDDEAEAAFYAAYDLDILDYSES